MAAQCSDSGGSQNPGAKAGGGGLNVLNGLNHNETLVRGRKKRTKSRM